MKNKNELYALSENEGDAIWFLDTLTFVKATSKQTGGSYGLIEQLIAAGFESPYHMHHNEDESFLLREGTATFIYDGATFEAKAGDYIFLPRNIPHGFRVNTECRLLIFNTPGGFEEFVIEMSEPAKELCIPHGRTTDMEKLLATATKYNIDILGGLPPV